MKKIKRVAIFSHASPDHIGWVTGMKLGMNQNGVDVLTSWPHPNGAMLDSIIENYRPDVVLEINRHKDQIPSISNDFFHVCFMHEHRAYDIDFTKTTGQSDFYYSIMKPSGLGFPPHLDNLCRPCMAGYNSNVLDTVVRQNITYDLGYAGYMAGPNVFHADFMKNLLVPEKPETGTLMDLVKYIGIDKKLILTTDFIETIRRKTSDYFFLRGYTNFDYSNYSENFLFRVCENTFLRFINRRQVAEQMLKCSDNLVFWGNEGWAGWPRFKPYYDSLLRGTKSVMEAYSSLKINVHSTGTNLHPRVIETMAVGRPIAIFRNKGDDGPYGLDQFFEPDVDYISVDFDNFTEKISYYLNNPNQCEAIAKSGQKKVRSSFTWKHRCRKIIDDLESEL